MPLPVRLQVLLETLGVDESIATALPPHLSLPVCVTCYWLRSAKPKPNQQMVQALMLGIVYGELSRLGGSRGGAAYSTNSWVYILSPMQAFTVCHICMGYVVNLY